jgi:hypothetical protein
MIVRLGMERIQADQLTARLRGQGMRELADGDRLRLTDKGRRATGVHVSDGWAASYPDVNQTGRVNTAPKLVAEGRQLVTGR